MHWNKRASKVETRLGGLSRWRHVKSVDGRYRVSERKWTGASSRPTRWYACVLVDGVSGPCWDVISTHRKEHTAKAACEKHAIGGRRKKRRAA